MIAWRGRRAHSQRRRLCGLACDRRSAFQRRLIDQPLMREVLGELAMEAEAALALAFRVAESFDKAETDPHEAALARACSPDREILDLQARRRI
ncbi:MAG: hypothetical protein JKP95_04130 [Oceanicaulis sp.]|nr:hypothetical protein [Oceanicaulis sp.]